MIPYQASRLLPISIATPELELEQEVNVYMLVNRGEALIIDAGYDAALSLAAIEACWLENGQPTVRALVVTHAHRDHIRAAPTVCDRFQCHALVHERDLLAFRTDVQRNQTTDGNAMAHIVVKLHDGDRIPFGDDELHVIHAPGHTPGHIHLWWEKGKTLFAGDNVLGSGSTWVGPPDGDLNDYLQTLDATLRMAPMCIAPGHGPFIEQPVPVIRKLIARRLQREQEILDLLSSFPQTVQSLTDYLYKNRVAPQAMWAALNTVEGHLYRLESLNRCRRRTEDTTTLWEIIPESV